MRIGSTVLALLTSVCLLATVDLAGAQEIPQPLFGNCCSCKAQIKFRPGLDFAKIGARLIPTTTAIIDPVATGMSIEISNIGGTFLLEAVPPGGFVEKLGGKKFIYKNKAAKTSGGVFRATIQERNDTIGGYIVEVLAYGDMSVATVPTMTTNIVIGTSPFFDNSDWGSIKNGWKTKFPLVP